MILQKIFKHISRYIHNNKSVTFVTGASESFYDTLRDNLLKSLYKFEKDAKIIVWDLGLNDNQIKELKEILSSLGGRIELYIGFDNLPSHYNMCNHNYAFKSYCIYKSMNICDTDYMFWLDAGCAISNKLCIERNLLSMYGFYSPYSSTTVSELTIDKVFDLFDDKLYSCFNKRMLSGGVVGIDVQNKKTRTMIREWYLHTYNKEYISPDKANLKNHRYDQSLLSLLYYSFNDKVPILARRLYNIKIHLNKGK